MSAVDLVVSPSWVYVYGPSQVDLLLSKSLKSRNPQAFWQNKKRRALHDKVPHLKEKYPLVDEFWQLYDRGRRRFPKGVLARVIKILKANGFAVRLSADDIGFRPSAFEMDEGHHLDPYEWQLQAPEKFFDAEFGICAVPTRGGKTIIGLRVATAFVSDVPVLYLVNKVEAQTSVIKHWKKHFDVSPVFSEVTEKNGLHVLTYQSAANRPLSHFGMVIGDEIHGVGADTFFDSLMRCESAWYRLGLTGTYEGRSDGKDLWIEAAAGPVYYEIPRQQVIDAGLCASGVVWQVPVNEPLPDVKGWRAVESEGIITEYRNSRLIECAMAAWEELDNEGQILCMVHKHEHGKMFAQQLSAVLGFEVPYVSSKTPAAQRKKHYEDLQSGKLKAVVASSIWNDSVTLPHVRVLINAPGGKSFIRTRQILGRALTGNKRIIVVDGKDSGHATLKRHAAARRRAYIEDGYEVKVWEP